MNTSGGDAADEIVARRGPAGVFFIGVRWAGAVRGRRRGRKQKARRWYRETLMPRPMTVLPKRPPAWAAIAACLALLAAQLPAQSDRTPLNLYGRGATGTNGVVAAARPEASRVGVEILRMGGNAVDAAVATGFALGVLEPNASGIGGGGFMLVKLAGMKDAVVIDFRPTAPAAATPDMYKLDARGRAIDNASVEGGLASAVPGEVRGLLAAFEQYGSRKLTRAQVIQPAIDWAERGVPVTVNLAQIIKDNFGKLSKFENGLAIYANDGFPPEIGDTIVNKDLAATLRLIQARGADAIYRGDIAARIVAENRKRGGILTAEDLAAYRVKVRAPIAGSYRGYTILTAPPPAGGTHVIQLLNIVEASDLQALGEQSAAAAHVWAEACKLVFADRARYSADPDFVTVPFAGLASKAYARTLAAQIKADAVLSEPAAGDPFKYESGSTTHFSVMDRDGNMVAVTKTINMFFASGVVVPGTGIIMGDDMDDFDLKPGSVNSIQPGKRMLSSMSPTLVVDPQGRPFMAIGSPGATRIIPTLAQVISNVIDRGMPIQQAISAPRLYQGRTGGLSIEGRYSINAYNGLVALGHRVAVAPDYDAAFGGVHAVLYDHAAKRLYGGADPRRDGQAAGY
jgi:gamma-glutamyltranspeptidase/glutathione hydrolase